MQRRIAIAADHGGFELKESLAQALIAEGESVDDLGVSSAEPSDYPDLAHELAERVKSGQADVGIAICGTGIGVSITANRHSGIRAALCTDPYMARMAREHNDANVLCLGARVVGQGLALEIVHAFLGGIFAGGRHLRRLQKIELP